MLYGTVYPMAILEVINFPSRGKEFYLKRLKKLARMKKVARTTEITTREELRQTENPAPFHESARIDQLERLEEDPT